MSHKSNQRGKGRPDKARPTVQHTAAPRAVRAVAPPSGDPPPVSVVAPVAPAAAVVPPSVAAPPVAPVPPVTVAPASAAVPPQPVPSPSAPTPASAPVAPAKPTPPSAPPAAPAPVGDVPPHPPNGPRQLNGHAPFGPAGHAATTAPPAPHGHLPAEGKPTKHITQRTATPPSELSEMFETLRARFVRDRSNGARPDAARCGICYLTFAREELTYHEDAGFYACPDCDAALHARGIAMLRRQRR